MCLISIKLSYVAVRQRCIKYVKMPHNFWEHQNSHFFLHLNFGFNISNVIMGPLLLCFTQVCLQQQKTIRMTELWNIFLIAELVCLFAENYNNLLSKVICFSFLWSVVAHLPCDLLRQSGHFWREKREKVGTSDLLQLLSYLRLSFFIFFLPPPTLLLFLRVCFMDEYCLAKNLSAPAPQDVSTHRTWQWIVYSQPGLATEKGDTGPLHIFPPQGIFSSSSENEW